MKIFPENIKGNKRYLFLLVLSAFPFVFARAIASLLAPGVSILLYLLAALMGLMSFVLFWWGVVGLLSYFLKFIFKKIKDGWDFFR